MSSDIPLSLPPEFNILDDDIIYVVTGYNKGNSVLVSKEASIQNLRKCFVQQLEGISGVGISSNRNSIYSTSKEGNLINLNYDVVYPHNQIISTTGLNTKTENLIVLKYDNQWPHSGVIYNTGLNAIVGNNMEIQFSAGSPAANKFGGVGGKYFSGIISTTGLNTKTANNIVLTFDSSWPNSGNIYNTGLNARAGNNIDIDFSTNRHLGMGAPYYSGTISTTGLNMIAGSGITFDISPNWPHPYVISTLDRTVYADASKNMIVDDMRTYSDPYIKPYIPNRNNKYPSLASNIQKGFLVEYCILSATLINNTPSYSIDTSTRPTTINGNYISWSSCYVTHLTPAALFMNIWKDNPPYGNLPITSVPEQADTFTFPLPQQGLSYYAYTGTLYNINLKFWLDINPLEWGAGTPDEYYAIYLQPRYSLIRSTFKWTCNGTYTYYTNGSYNVGNTVWNSTYYTSDMRLNIKDRYMKLVYGTKEKYVLNY